MSAGADTGIFRLRTVAWLVAVGVVGFLGTLVLGAYAPDLRSGHNGGAHALSNAAVGYSGIVTLAEATGRHPHIRRDERRFDGDDLLVLTPELGTVDVSKPIAARANKPTLMVLPKWATESDPDHDGWVRYDEPWPAFVPQGVLAPDTQLRIARVKGAGRLLVASPLLPAGLRLRAPRPLQVILGSTPRRERMAYGTRLVGTVHPLITDGAGHAVLVRIDNTPLYVLSDPDLLSNLGMRDADGARSMLAVLDWLGRATPDVGRRREPDGIDFDVTLNGFGRSRSPLKLAFEPPFLAMTLAIAAALLLAGLHAAGRFGAPRPPARAIAFGTAALVDNAAALVRKAGRQGRMGGRYAEVVRERARTRFGVPARVTGAGVDTALDRMGGARPFTALADAARTADDPAGVLAAAQALSDWQGRRA